MLEPAERHVYLDALRPPAGYVLDRAIGTTFSLDLPTLLTIPLSFALFDHSDAHEEMLRDQHALLEALRRYSDRILVFTQAGRIGAPTASHPLFAYLEPMVVEVNATSADGVFHPKCWVLRFTRGDDVRYRFLCLTRNLTTDRSWDTVLALDGELADRKRAFARNHPLADFVAALPGLSTRSDVLSEQVEVIADELRRVDFEVPTGFEKDELRFHPIGILKTRVFEARRDRMLVIAPFLSEDILAELAGSQRNSILVSRAETLDEMSPEVLSRFDRVFYFDDDIGDPDDSLDELDGSGSTAARRGLHAKLFVADDGWYASVWTGSANATHNGFHRNVELLVQLRAKKSVLGIDQLIGTDEKPSGLRNLLRPYEIKSERTSDSEQKQMEEILESWRRQLARAALSLEVERSAGHEGFDVTLTAGELPEAVANIRGRCWLVGLGESHAVDLQPLIEKGRLGFSDVSLLGLSSFVAFEVFTERDGSRLEQRFVLNVPVRGMPEERLRSILTHIILDRAGFLRYLALLLQQETDCDPGLGVEAGVAFQHAVFGTFRESGLLESLVRTAARNPERLRRVKELVDEIRASDPTSPLVPEDFDAVWRPIWASLEEA